MKKMMVFFRGAALAGVLILTPVLASALVFDLNTLINGNSLSTISSWGDITISQNGSSVNILVDLQNPGDSTDDLRVQKFFLNYDDDKFSNLSAFTLAGTTVQVAENNQQADGYSLGKFDLQMPATGNLGWSPFSGALSLGGVSLFENDFNFMDTSDKLWAAVHIGSIGSTEYSLWIGAGDGSNPPPPPVPEPSTLILLGGGLLGLALYGKRRMKAR